MNNQNQSKKIISDKTTGNQTNGRNYRKNMKKTNKFLKNTYVCVSTDILLSKFRSFDIIDSVL